MELRRKKRIKVLVVDDSVIFRRVLANAVESDDRLELIGTAPDAFKAVEFIEENCPDVITLDIEMPHMDGLTFLRKLMHQHPIPVIMVSSITKGNKEVCMKAYSTGAVDIIDKPQRLKSTSNLYEFYAMVCEKIIEASQANIVQKRKIVLDLEQTKPPVVRMEEKTEVLGPPNTIIAIGASAGGTTAIEFILRNLPNNMPGIIITQHMPEGFTKLFADRLNDLCVMQVKEAEENDRVIPGRALIAPGGKHLVLKGSGGNYWVSLSTDAPVNRHRPSVDVMFDSVAALVKSKAIGVILTGMGGDGAKGLLAMRESGAFTIAQDKDSCVVYGMPQQAILLGAAKEIKSLKEIPNYLVDKLKGKAKF
jgi:two-component system, chemotaxis family, protein-glutamate methylesterase/glutaminase